MSTYVVTLPSGAFITFEVSCAPGGDERAVAVEISDAILEQSILRYGPKGWNTELTVLDGIRADDLAWRPTVPVFSESAALGSSEWQGFPRFNWLRVEEALLPRGDESAE